jgi:hypothetical protein
LYYLQQPNHFSKQKSSTPFDLPQLFKEIVPDRRKMKLPKFSRMLIPIAGIVLCSCCFKFPKIWSKACCLIARSVLAVIPIPEVPSSLIRPDVSFFL